MSAIMEKFIGLPFFLIVLALAHLLFGLFAQHPAAVFVEVNKGFSAVHC